MMHETLMLFSLNWQISNLQINEKEDKAKPEENGEFDCSVFAMIVISMA